MFKLSLTAEAKAQLRGPSRLLDRLLRPNNQDRRGISNRVRDGFATNFRSQRGGGRTWRPLAKSTQEGRRRLGYPASSPILIRSGSYQATFLNPGNPDYSEEFAYTQLGWSIEWGSDDIRDTTLQLGRPSWNIPGRPVTILNRSSEKKVLDSIDELIIRLERRNA